MKISKNVQRVFVVAGFGAAILMLLFSLNQRAAEPAAYPAPYAMLEVYND